MNKVISLVIASYNMEAYLPRCLDSVLIPEILDKIEIIIVNDGSTDNTLTIAQSYKDRFPQAVVIIDKSNGHYGSCINAALKIAMGKYFRPLDADDWFDSDAFVYFVDKLQDIIVDMIFANFSYEYGESGTSRIVYKKRELENIISEEIHDLMNHHFINSEKMLKMHGITYRTDLLKAMGFRCTEGICYTDTEYCFYPLEYAKTFTYINIVLYKYYIGRDEQTVSSKSFVKNRDHVYVILCRIIEYFSDMTDPSDVNNHEKQYSILKRAVVFYYLITLCYAEWNAEGDEKLINIDSALKRIDSNLYNSLDHIRFRSIRYIYLWRVKHIYCGRTIMYKFNFRIYDILKYLYRWIVLRLRISL